MQNDKILFATHPNSLSQNEKISIIYDKWRNRLFDYRLPIHIFGTGSEGNSIYLKPQKTLIDLGLPFKRYEEFDPLFFLKIDYIILTHHHSDHLNPATLFNILKHYPNIHVIIPKYMWTFVTGNQYKAIYKKVKDELGNTVYQLNNEGKPIKTKPMYEIDPFTGQKVLESLQYQQKFLDNEHRFVYAQTMELKTHDNRKFLFAPRTTKHGDIMNIAIQIYDPEFDLRLLYASDLDNLLGESSFTDYNGVYQQVEGLSQDAMYNCIFLEANYDEELLETWTNEKLEAIESRNDLPDFIKEKEKRNIIARSSGNKRHISEQETFKYIQQRLDPGGVFMPLHASKSFGTLIQKQLN